MECELWPQSYASVMKVGKELRRNRVRYSAGLGSSASPRDTLGLGKTHHQRGKNSIPQRTCGLDAKCFSRARLENPRLASRKAPIDWRP